MSWLCSQALVAEFSAGTCLDGEPSVQSSESHTPLLYFAPGKTTVFSRLSRFGMMFAPLTEGRGEELLTWYLAGFPARTSALPEKAQDSTASAADSGPRWRGSLAKYDPVSHSLKTAQLSLIEDSTGCSPTLPRSGLMRRGECYPLLISGHRICGSGSGLSGEMWQTPVADDSANRAAGKWNSRGEPKLSAQVHLQRFPTPRAEDSQCAGGHRGKDDTLYGMICRPKERLPTPTAGDAKSSGSRNTANSNAHAGTSLTDYVRGDGGRGRAPAADTNSIMNCSDDTVAPTVSARMFPTATAGKGWSKNHNRAQTDDRIDYTIEREAHEAGQPGRLNPTWVEWLMAWPLAWTDLKPLETDRFLEWQRQHLPNWRDC